MDIDNILLAMAKLDQARDEAREKIISSTPANGSHIYIEGSTGEGKLSILPNQDIIQVTLA